LPSARAIVAPSPSIRAPAHAIMTASLANPELKRTPLHRLHVALEARIAPFAGYEMPIQYPTGILKEHLHTRAAAGLFDVSHMGQFEIRARSGRWEATALALESVVPTDVLGLAPGRQRYALLTNDRGGIRDDLMIARLDDRFRIVANAARKDADEIYLKEKLSNHCEIERYDDAALLALQGPMAENALAALIPDVRSMRFMDIRAVKLMDADCIVSRSGYTGEDGFEISVPATIAEAVSRALLEFPQTLMIGLGARDSLRLEAGLCLYGSDLDPATTPVEAALEWSIPAARKFGGSRVGGFPGAETILDQLANGAPRRRVGLRPEGRASVRHDARLFRHRENGNEIGLVTSGGFGPSVNAPIAMGYVPAAIAGAPTPIYAELRGERIPVRQCQLPFVASRYKR
jgi:aminomethyltransferase